MQKFKVLMAKYWIILSLLGAVLSGLALLKMPNLSTLALNSFTPKSELINAASKTNHHWSRYLKDATPVSITYSVPTEFSPSQKMRLENKERFLIEHQPDLRIYKVTSSHNSPHAHAVFTGKNWHKLELWIPQNLANHPLYQAQLRHLCALTGIKTNWHNPINERYQDLVKQWYQQKIFCIWVLVISFITLLLTTSIIKAFILTITNLEVCIITLSCLANLIKPFFFYLPLIVVLLTCLITFCVMLFNNQPKWLTKFQFPMQTWHPLIKLLLISSLIFPLLTNCQIHFQQPRQNQTITVYLTSKKNLLQPQSLTDLDHLTKVIKALPNVSHIYSLTQPGGQEINKYQLGNQLNDIEQNLISKQKVKQTATHKFAKLIGNQQIPNTLETQADQIKQLETKTESDDAFTKMIKEHANTQSQLTNQLKQQTSGLDDTKTQLAEINANEEIQILSQIQKQSRHQFYLSNQDARDSDFSQTCFNFNNETQTATRIEITLKNGKLGHLPKLIKHQLSGTKFSSNIGINGIPVAEATQQQTFKTKFPLILLCFGLLILIFNSIRFKSISFSLLIIILIGVASAASLGMLNYFTNYQFNQNTSYLLLSLVFIFTLLPRNKNTILLSSLMLVPFFLVSQFHALGIILLTFALIYHSLLPVLLKINQQKRLLFRSLFPKKL